MTADDQARVLVVDDEPDNLALFRRVFRGEYKLTLAPSAAEARAHLARGSFDIVLSDFAMPDENGVALLTHVREKYPDVQRVLVTAYADLTEVRNAADAGVVSAVIIKPWDCDVVARSVTQGQRLANMRRGVASMGHATAKKE